MDRQAAQNLNRDKSSVAMAARSGSVSVVIPVHNAAPFIADTIASVLAQGDCVREVIVVDDGSSDGSGEVAAASGDPRVRVITMKSSVGVSAARNIGVRETSGEWLYFIDADDLARPGALDELLNAAGTKPDVGLVYGDYDRIRQDGASAGNRRHFMAMRRKPTGDVLESIVQKNCMVVGAQIVRREIFDACGGFDETLRKLEDWHFWCLAAARTEFLFVPGLYVMSYRVHETSTMHTRLLPFDAVKPGIEAVYSDPSITARLDAKRLAGFRRSTEAAMLSYLASVAVRLGTYRAGLAMIFHSIRRDPARGPRAMAQFAGAFVGL